MELFRALEPHVGAEAAQMIADVVPPASNLATKEDIQALRADLFRWGLTAFVPMWLTVVALVVELLTR